MASLGAAERTTGPYRSRPGPWLLLCLVDLIAIATLARCFSGPGELALALPTCLLAHLLCGGGRRLAPWLARRHRHAPAARVMYSGAGWLVALLVTLLLPLAALEAHSFTVGLPLAGTWHAVHGQLSTAWTIFSDKIAPVAEVPGLVLVTAWAAGAVALASEVLYADAGLPAILALVPAFDVVVFTGTLGTSTGRAFELAAIAATSLAFLVSAQSDRRQERRVVRARADVGSEAALGAPTTGEPAFAGPGQRRRRPSRKLALPGVTLLAAVAAGVIGPALPGATSPPLIAWHGLRALRGNRHGHGHGNVAPAPNKIYVSDFVQVAEEEVENSGALLFTVHSAVRLSESLVSLDQFNGVSWSRIDAGSGVSSAVPQFSATLSHLERHLPAPTSVAAGARSVEQVIEIGGLGGEWLPTPGVTTGIDGPSDISEVGLNGPIASLVPLTANLTYGLRATVATSSSTLLSTVGSVGGVPGDSTDLELPTPIPASLVRLADRIATGAANPYQIAERLQDYFADNSSFSYHLPAVTPSGAISDTSQTYKALEAFLFQTRTGYCQQYATAFAVLARILGLPTRIVVGFVPGKEIGHDEYVVTGTDVHAWPEIDFGQFGWISFEPTPGAAQTGPSSRNQTTTTLGNGKTPVTAPKSGNSTRLRQYRGAPTGAGKRPAPVKLARQKGSSDAGDLLLAVLFLALAWVVGVPSWRLFLRRRHRRDVGRSTLAAWRSAIWTLAAAGAHRRRAETHLEFVDRVRRLGVLSSDANLALERLARRADRTLYAPAGPGRDSPEGAALAWAESDAIRRSARRRISHWQQLSLLLDPRDLLEPT
jgi:transglutaminase-like putative cysteine protease